MRTNVTPMKPDADNGSCPAKIRRRGPATAEARTELPVTHGDQHGKAVTTTRPERRFPRAMSDQDRRHSVTDAALCRGARSPDPGAVRLAGHMGGRGQHRQALPSIRPEVSHWKGPAPCDRPRSRRLIDGQVNRDASPHAESPGSSLRRRPQLAATCRRSVLRVGARAGPARTAAGAVPAVLAEQDRPGPSGIRWLQSGRAARTGLTGMPTGVSPLAAPHRLPMSCSPRSWIRS